MGNYTENEKLQALAEELAQDIHTEEDLAELSRALLKVTVERALAAELDHHLGYKKHAPEGRNSGNSRNGTSSKTLKGDTGEVEIATPRDRNGTFQPRLLGKGQRRLGKFEGQILSLYAKGMTTRDIAEVFEEMYDVEVSHTLISQVTEAVMDQVRTWQERPLDEVYPVVFLDGIVVKVRLGEECNNTGLGVRCILLRRISGWSTRRCIWPWGSRWRAIRTCWACGSPRPKGPSFG